MTAAAFVFLQHILPQHLLTRLIWRIARIRNERVKDFLITRFIDAFNVETDEVALSIPEGFATFNDFFIRELSPGARPIDDDIESIVSPVDGTVSVAGEIRSGELFQAKNRNYSLQDLLATDIDEAEAYVNGRFATIYLAPYNYHRIHAPLAGELVAARYVPGELYSVNQTTVSRVDGLFRRNERLVMHFQTALGPAAVIFVGALNVGSISTPWSGEIRPKKHGIVESVSLAGHTSHVEKGELLGWFNMGSTVILLMPDGAMDWQETLLPGTVVKMGQRIGARMAANT